MNPDILFFRHFFFIYLPHLLFFLAPYFSNMPYSNDNCRKRPRFNQQKEMRKVAYKAIKDKTETKKVGYVSSANLDDTPTVSQKHLVAIAQGLDDDNRIGNEVLITGLHITGLLNNLHTGDGCFIRVILGYAKNVGYQASPFTHTIESIIDHDQFHILKDFVMTLPSTQNNDNTRKTFTVSQKFPQGLRIKYSGANDTDILGKDLVLYAYSDIPNAGNPCYYYTRGYVYFKDA